MAKREHVDLVLQGVDATAAWKREHPHGSLELRRADFTHAQLSGINLGAANLEWADFRWADLVGADLSGARLSRADFHKADLARANLQSSDLTMANLEDANFRGAILKDALFSHTMLINTDLSEARGLESCRYSGSSTIDPQTLAKSGTLPLEFPPRLRGVRALSGNRLPHRDWLTQRR